MYGMFDHCTNFNQPFRMPANAPNGSGRGVLHGCYNFNQPITIENNTHFSIAGNTFSFAFINNAMGDGTGWKSKFIINVNADDFRGQSIYRYIYSIYGSGYNFNNFNAPVNINIKNGTISLNGAFYGMRNFNSPVFINSNVNNMDGFIYNNSNVFNASITMMNGVENCANMLCNLLIFNRPISIPSSVTNTYFMLSQCPNFNSTITIQDGVTNLSFMMYLCNNFNRPITIPSSVTNVYDMVYQCPNFNSIIRSYSSCSPNSIISTYNNNLNYTLYFYNKDVDFSKGFHVTKNGYRRLSIYIASQNNFDAFNSKVRRISVYIGGSLRSSNWIKVSNDLIYDGTYNIYCYNYT
jgi:hypothetical protein